MVPDPGLPGHVWQDLIDHPQAVKVPLRHWNPMDVTGMTGSVKE